MSRSRQASISACGAPMSLDPGPKLERHRHAHPADPARAGRLAARPPAAAAPRPRRPPPRPASDSGRPAAATPRTRPRKSISDQVRRPPPDLQPEEIRPVRVQRHRHRRLADPAPHRLAPQQQPVLLQRAHDHADRSAPKARSSARCRTWPAPRAGAPADSTSRSLCVPHAGLVRPARATSSPVPCRRQVVDRSHQPGPSVAAQSRPCAG